MLVYITYILASLLYLYAMTFADYGDNNDKGDCETLSCVSFKSYIYDLAGIFEKCEESHTQRIVFRISFNLAGEIDKKKMADK